MRNLMIAFTVAILVLSACEVVFFGIDITVWFAYRNRPIELATHHDALEQRLAAHMGFQLAILSERA